MKHETAGDPMTGLKWSRRTTGKIAAELQRFGIDVSAKTVSRLLKQMGYSLRVNHKKLSLGSGPDRDEQFAYIAETREQFAQQGWPIVSVDTKKKELVGNFKNGGAAWNREPRLVNDHDFRSTALGIAIPYGVYDLQSNRGSLFIGTSHDTPQFAVDNLVRITVTVCHYPTGASKWNPIEHRLFSEISKNWAGRPLDSYETIVNYARSTTTATGLRLKAYLIRTAYPEGVRITEPQMKQLRVQPHATQPKRNYTLSPR